MAPPLGPRRVLWVVKRHDVCDPDRVRVDLAGDEAGRVRRVEHEAGPDLVGDLPERLRVDHTGIGGGTCDDQPRPLPDGKVADEIQVDPLARTVGGRRCDPVRDEPVQLAGDGDRRAVCQVPALIEAHRHDGVAGLDEREIGRQVRVRACVRLDVGMLRAEQLHRPRAGEVLHLVSDDVTAVVTPTGVTLGVLVRQHRGGGREHGGRREVLRRDQLKVGSLPLDLAL